MATFVMFSYWTDQGWRNLKDRPQRLRQRDPERAGRLGIERKAQFFLNGPVDVVTIFEAPSEEALTRYLLPTATEGNVRRTVVRAFSWEEYLGFLQQSTADEPTPGG
jgi:uncharacterized protein with GYD domain